MLTLACSMARVLVQASHIFAFLLTQSQPISNLEQFYFSLL